MWKVTQQVVDAFLAGRSRTVGNTETDGYVLRLHGNVIAWYDGWAIQATLAGWPTVTTRERLNGLCERLGIDRRFRQRRGCQYFGRDRILSDAILCLWED